MKKEIKITIWLFAGFIVFAILHNAIYGIFGAEEAVFFSLSLLSALGFVIALVYSIVIFVIKKVKHKKKAKKK